MKRYDRKYYSTSYELLKRQHKITLYLLDGTIFAYLYDV
jgi:hypothetical protein